jgi:hypothetical protein
MKILNKSTFKKDDHVLVFDSKEWSKTGDIGDNSQFYKPAIITKIRQTKDSFKEWLADVIFDSRIESFGHFQSGIKLIK